MNTEQDYQDGADVPLTTEEFALIVRESLAQPPWRTNADREADYADGNQLDTELLRKQAKLGIPPAKENVIKPAIAAICGYEAKTRTDWRVTPDGDPESKDVADALNYKLNQAERHSKADRAMSEAFKAQITVGLGWVEVKRAANSLMYPYEAHYVHRNEIWWDMRDTSPDLRNARWLYRRRWLERSTAATMFPKHRDIIMNNVNDWIGEYSSQMIEGGQSTGLLAAINAERAWTVEEDQWYNAENRTVCITEVWYRRWVPTRILKLKNGRAVRFDEDNQLHLAAVMAGRGKLVEELIPKMRRAYYMGPHCLHDGPSPYPHDRFPYVPFWGYREDMTMIPYGLVRDMIFPQDNLNSSIAKLRWGIASVRTERTKGAVAMSDAQFRQQVGSVNADIVLDPEQMSRPGARFEVKRDFQLNDQHFQLMQDSRVSMERVSGVSAAFMGKRGTATSGIQEQTQVEQSEVTLADLFDNFRDARTLVGELLMSLIIEDMGREEQVVVIEGSPVRPARTVILNHPERDPATGYAYLSNDIQRARLKVALEDVPTSSGFRAQQLASLSEAVKSAPAQLQQALMPFMVELMDIPYKEEVVETIQRTTQQPDPEELRKQIEEEVKAKLLFDLKAPVEQARADLLRAQTVQTGVQASYSAMQAGGQIAMNPQIAPIADVVMQGAGYQRPNPMGDDPNFPVPGQQAAPVADAAMPEARENTSPAYPPVPQQPGQGMEGIETPELTDNL